MFVVDHESADLVSFRIVGLGIVDVGCLDFTSTNVELHMNIKLLAFWLYGSRSS
jgi:hypothetical protein